MNATASTTSRKKNSYLLPMIIISTLFFIFGFVTWLNGILIPYLKIACQLTDFEALLVATAFYISYTVMALPSAWVLKKTGLKNGMMVGLWVMAAGTLIFIPAALTRTYATFLLGLFVMGTGLAILQTASNPYVTIMGPRESAAKRISILGICNKVAGAIAPLILAYYILSDGDAFLASLQTMSETAKIAALDTLARRVINPYLVMTIVLFILGIFVRLSGLPELEVEPEEEVDGNKVVAKKNIFGYPHLILGVVTLFLYVGVEVIAGDTIIRYGQSLGIAIQSAKYFTSLVMMSMVVGYIVGIIFIPKYLDQRIALIGSAVLGTIFALFAIFVPQELTITFNFIDLTTFKPIVLTVPYTALFVALFGLANALCWPAIWPLAIHNLGKFLKTGSALLIMAIAGGAILPLIWGKLSDHFGTQNAYWVAIPAYLFILFYAVRGYKVKSWK